MRNILSLCVLVLFATTELKSQYEIDTALFDCTEEYDLFRDYRDDNAFDLLYLVDYDGQSPKDLHKQWFYLFLDEMKKDLPKKDKKKAAVIYEGIHEMFLRKYVDNPDFATIFRKGEYNCVTATALYALALQHFQIPFEIRELPTHVYLIVYPDTEPLLFETTTPEDGMAKFSQKRLAAYRDYLVDNKIITPQEAEGEDFFEDHVLADSAITIRQLVGILYFNNSIRYADEENWIVAAQQAEKAYLLRGGANTREWINHLLLANLLTLEDQTSSELCRMIDKIHRYSKDTEDVEVTIEELYAAIVETVAEQDHAGDRLIELHHCLRNSIADEEITEKLAETTHLYLAWNYYEAADFDRALQSLAIIYDDQKDNLNLAVQDCLSRKLGLLSNPMQGLDTIEHYQHLFPFIAEDEVILAAKAWFVLKLAYTHFELDEIDEGMVYLNRFREEFAEKKQLKYPEDMLGYTFGSISALHFRKGDYDKAEAYLLEGLEYDAYNLVLKRKLKVLREYVEER